MFGFFVVFSRKIVQISIFNVNISRTAWPILMIFVSFCRILNGLSDEINLFWRCSSPLKTKKVTSIFRVSLILGILISTISLYYLHIILYTISLNVYRIQVRMVIIDSFPSYILTLATSINHSIKGVLNKCSRNVLAFSHNCCLDLLDICWPLRPGRTSQIFCLM